MTGNRKFNLQQYELEDEEWDIVEQLRDILSVRLALTYKHRMLNIELTLTSLFTDLLRRNTILLS